MCPPGVTEQLIGLPAFGTGGFRYCGNILPLARTWLDESRYARLIASLQEIAAALTVFFRLRGLNGIDFVLQGDEIVVLEVNPRYCSSMELIEKTYQVPVFDLHFRAVHGVLPSFHLLGAPVQKCFLGKSGGLRPGGRNRL